MDYENIMGYHSLSFSLSLSTFLQLVEGAKDSVADMGKCFLDQVIPLLMSCDHHIMSGYAMQAVSFEVYVPYCENKPKSESFLWTYAHSGGNFFAVRSAYTQKRNIHSNPIL